MSEYGQFLRGLLDNPRGVSSPTPSSAALAAAIAAKVDPALPGLVVELGPGTGAITQALLERGVAPSRLVAIEAGEYFAGLLMQRFADVCIVQGDALQFERYLPPAAPIAAVVSGLPLLNFPVPARRALIEKALALQGDHGRFIQLSFGWQPAVPPGGDFALEKTLVWRNVPPAHIWTYSRVP